MHEPSNIAPKTASPASERPLRLDHAAIVTTQLEPALAFYVELLGLRATQVADDPLRPGHQRALLADPLGQDVLEIIERPELEHPVIPGRGGLHHLGFRMTKAGWHALRARLDARAYDYQEREGRLFIRDADGLLLEIEQQQD